MIEKDLMEQIIAKHQQQKGALITILQKTQEAYGYLPREKLEQISDSLKISLSKIYGVATFYSQFHLKPRGKHVIRVCLGTACHVRGGERIFESMKEKLGIAEGETTADGKFTLEKVACLGACGLAPAMTLDDVTYGRLTPEKAFNIVKGEN